MVSLGVDYKINSRFNLKLEPTFRYGVLKTVDAPLTAYLWNAGLNLTFFYGAK